MTNVTQILSEIEHGDPTAAEQLLPLLYDELRKLAVQKLGHEKPGQTLQATALIGYMGVATTIGPSSIFRSTPLRFWATAIRPVPRRLMPVGCRLASSTAASVI